MKQVDLSMITVNLSQGAHEELPKASVTPGYNAEWNYPHGSPEIKCLKSALKDVLT